MQLRCKIKYYFRPLVEKYCDYPELKTRFPKVKHISRIFAYNSYVVKEMHHTQVYHLVKECKYTIE